MPNLQIDAVVPMLCVTLGALAAMAGEALRGKGPRMPVGWFGIIGLAGAAISAVILWNPTPEAFREDFGVIVSDNFGLFVTLVLTGVGILTVMFSSQVIHRDNLPAGEYYALLLFSIVGMIMMATATDLLVIFVALEILSLAVYVLTGIRREVRLVPRRPSSISCSAPSPARSSSTALPSPTASRAARGCRRSRSTSRRSR